MMRPTAAIVLALVACGHGATQRDGAFDPLFERHVGSTRADRMALAPFENPAGVRYHMARHVDDLRDVEQLLIANKLVEAKTRAFLLTRPATEATESGRVTDAAVALTEARSIGEACHREARVAQACAECHSRTPHLPLFARAPHAPPLGDSSESRMARHRWAVDRLWEGMVGAQDAAWYGGLEVLATTPPPTSSREDTLALGTLLRRRARDAQAMRAMETLDDRARVYGEILVTCAACHDAAKRADLTAGSERDRRGSAR
jgi:hypothetical protein